jgi:hypothetical protein
MSASTQQGPMIPYRMQYFAHVVSPAALGGENMRQYRAGDDKGIAVANLQG